MADSNVGPEGIEGLERLKIPQSSFTLNRRPRPPPIDVSAPKEHPRLPSNNVPIHRQQSRGGIRGIFNRNKAEKTVITPTLEVQEPHESSIRRQPKDDSSEQSRTTLEAMKSPITPGKPAAKASRMNLRGRSAKETPVKPTTKPVTKSSPGRTSAVWDPPPLFQAYPQAIKHAQLSASTLSADAILRISNHKRNNSLTEYNPTATDEEKTAKKVEKAKSKHRRQLSGSLSKAEWTQKIFVLVTSGYLLQYAGEGSFDRLPEKMMQLGKDSVAFVSDVIPGKHWVLQISQSMDADGTPIADSRSLLSRLTFRGGADYRRTATSLLLVLDSVEEMESWLTVFRREIESLGGKKHIPDIARQKSDEKVHQLVKQPSHRYLVAKNPDQFSAPISPSALGIVPAAPWTRSNSMNDELSSQHERPFHKQPFGQQSATNSIVSHDGTHLEELRESNRFSYMSSGQRTSTQYSSPESSPTRENSLSMFRDPLPKKSMEDVNMTTRPNAAAINERRRSMQTMPVLTYEGPHASKIQRHSTYGPPNSVTPNFSVPNSSSRRFSTAKNRSITPVDSSMSVRSRSSESPLRGNRKTPPPAISIIRSLSPVLDDASPLQQQESHAMPQISSSNSSLQQITASVIDIAPRSPLPEPSPKEISHTPARSLAARNTSTPMREPGTSHLNFEFPKRPTSMYHDNTSDKAINHTTVTLPNKRHSLASPERHDHIPHSPFTPTRDTMPSPPPMANISKPLKHSSTNAKLRPMSFTPPSSMTHPSYPFPRVASANSSRTSTPTPRSNHQSGISDLPDLPTKSDLRSKVPSLQRLRASDEASHKALSNRRSMPFLVGGPPPAPPPDCALPALPPAGVVGKRLSVKV